MDIVWTAEQVRAELVRAFMAAPSMAVLSPRRGAFVRAVSRERVVEWDIIAASYEALGKDATPDDRERRLMLLTWARVTALAEVGDRDASMRQICLERGWQWSRFLRVSRQAAWQMATHLNTASSAVQQAMALTAQPAAADDLSSQ